MGKKNPNILKRAAQAAKYVFSYDAAKNTRHRATRGVNSIRSEEIELDRLKRDRVISACLDFKRNNPVVNSLSRLRKADVVGRGILPQPTTGDQELDRELESRWMEFSAAPEATGQMDMREVQQQMADALLFYGDCGLIWNKGKVEFIDGSRIGNEHYASTSSEASPMQNGVEVNSVGKPINYFIGDRINGVLKNVSPTSAANFYPFFRRTAPIQYRGIPELSSVLNTLQDCDEYDKVEMIAAKAAAAYSVFVESENPLDMQLDFQDEGDDQANDLQSIEPGAVYYGKPGEKASVISTNGRPNVDGIQWVSYLLRKVGSAVGIPLEFMLMEIGGSSFSASQGVVLQYQQTVESYQSDMIRVLNRVYRRWVTQLIADNQIAVSEGVKPFGVRWQRPAFRWINRAAQVKADMEYFRAGAMSLDDITAPFGYTSEDVLLRKAQNIRRAKEIAEEYDLEDWRELINPFQTSLSGDYQQITGEIDNQQ